MLGPDLLVRKRKSRILHNRQMFDYPLKANIKTIGKLGWAKTGKIAASYAKARLMPKPENSLADFLINRFGNELYEKFFQSYTEKVWGRKCEDIPPDWGAQRVKGLNMAKAVKDALGIKSDETSLIPTFLYPRLGPGQMWETTAERITALGGEIIRGAKATKISAEGTKITGVTYQTASGEQHLSCSHLISSMPVKDLVAGFNGTTTENIKEIGRGLEYRDFITVGLKIPRLNLGQPHEENISDNWIYIQETDVRLGRLQIFNNWSPELAGAESHYGFWLGLEYFCQAGDDLWSKNDEELKMFAAKELAALGMIHPDKCAPAAASGIAIRAEKAYPAYSGTFARFSELRTWADTFENLFLVGRNGMHRYNNQDHAMETGIAAARKIKSGDTDKTAIWATGNEKTYLETCPKPQP